MSYSHLLPPENYRKPLPNMCQYCEPYPEKPSIIQTLLEFGVELGDIYTSLKNGTKNQWKILQGRI